MVTMLFFQVLVLPVNIAFYSSDFSVTWLAINGISDAVFLIDIVFNFFTGIPDLDDEHLVRYDGVCYPILVQSYCVVSIHLTTSSGRGWDEPP